MSLEVKIETIGHHYLLNPATISADRPIMLSGAPTIPAGTQANPPREVLLRGARSRSRARLNAIAMPLMSIAVVSIVLATIVLIFPIPPLVESDYAYLLTAADRLVDGNGLTTTPPLAPNQSWQWSGDWTYLTKWPVGYSILIAGLKSVLGTTALQAARWISIIACAVALVGWFTWMLQLIPSGITRYILAATCAGLSLPTAWLINPSTDLIVVAAIPWLMMATVRVVLDIRNALDDGTSAQTKALGSGGDRNFLSRPLLGCSIQSLLFLSLIGGASGALVWFRYASVFVTLAIGSYLFYEWFVRKGLRLAHVISFGLGSALPIATLLIVNTLLGSGESASSQLNLGDRMGFDFSFALLWRAWWMFTDLGYYAHRAAAHWTVATWPIVLIAGAVAIRPMRETAAKFLAKPAVALSVAVAVSLMTMLVVAKVLFSGKFDYVGLDRYYQPIKPLYLVIFVAPLVVYCGKRLRASACVVLMLACMWTVQQSWTRTYVRWDNANRPTTLSGSWSRCFEPGANELYDWLASQKNESIVVASNFHEFIAFETKIPAIPTPPNRATLDKWVAQIRETRNVDNVRVIFALDPSNKWRDYWLESPEEIIERLGLTPIPNTPPTIAPFLFELPTQTASVK